MLTKDRRRLATEAALGVAQELGIDARRPRILKDSNNTIVHLAPAPVVAKVGTSHFRDAKLESLERELAVTTHLAEGGSPTIRPVPAVDPGPHVRGDVTLTLWRYVHPLRGATIRPTETAVALRAIHEGLADFPGSLPVFTLELDARRLLEPDRSPSLATADRRFLLGVLDEVQTALLAITTVNRPLHGSPHEGNGLATPEGMLLLDFETACLGPIEWDLAALEDDAVDMFHGVEHELITLLRRMRSVCVAAKCWVEPNRAPEVFEAARVHLRLLRGEPLT